MKNNLKKSVAPKGKATISTKQKSTGIREDTLFWKKELEELKSKSYASPQALIDAVIEKVLTKYESPEAEKEDTREFLKLLLDTDEGFQDEIKKFVG